MSVDQEKTPQEHVLRGLPYFQLRKEFKLIGSFLPHSG